MLLNCIWISFFLTAFLTGIVRLIFFHDLNVFPGIMGATFEYAKTGFEISLGLTGVLTLWLGLMRVGEKGMMNVSANLLLFIIIILFILLAIRKRVNVYKAFIEGAKDGFGVAIHIIPYLIAILVAIGVFRASGAMDMLVGMIRGVFALLSIDTGFTDALPTAFMKLLSGNGAMQLKVESWISVNS